MREIFCRGKLLSLVFWLVVRFTKGFGRIHPTEQLLTLEWTNTKNRVSAMP